MSPAQAFTTAEHWNFAITLLHALARDSRLSISLFGEINRVEQDSLSP